MWPTGGRPSKGGAQDVIDRLGLEPHPEGGFYTETWRDASADGGRGSGSAIYFLLRREDRSHWHRVDAEEIWLFHAGAPLLLERSPDAVTPPDEAVLGVELAAGQSPQLRVPAGWWQAARSTGDWTLVSCTVSPAFCFDGFELASSDFVPGG